MSEIITVSMRNNLNDSKLRRHIFGQYSKLLHLIMNSKMLLFTTSFIAIISAIYSSNIELNVCQNHEDIYYFTNLKSIKFDCSERNYEFEAHNLAELKLNCDGTSINNSEIIELTIDWCAFDRIPAEIFQIFENLKKFTIKSENIESINKGDLNGANRLESLGIYGNGIHYGEALFTHTPKIRAFYVFNVEKSYFHEETFKGPYRPKILNLKQSDLTKTDRNDILALSNDIESIIVANCSIHQIESLNERFNSNQIKWIDFENNFITELNEKSFDQLAHLRILNLLHNSIKTIAPNTFTKLSRLIFLGLSWNQLDSLTMAMLEGASNVMIATFHGNKIKSIEPNTFSTMKNLKKLILSYNEISALDARTFNGLNNLEYLELSFNPILSVDAATFSDLIKLKELGLRDGKLTSIDLNAFVQLPNLKFLDLSDNSISQLIKASNRTAGDPSTSAISTPLAKIDKDLLQLFFEHDYILKVLNISFDRGMDLFNETKDIVYPNNENKLTMLDLSQNDLTSLDDDIFNGFENLRGLFLYRNKISTIHSHAFNGLSKLTHLDLSQCQLTTIDFDLLSQSSKLQDLNLKDNQIKNVIIPRSMQPFQNLSKMNLEDNKLIWRPSFNRRVFPKLNVK